MSIPFGGRVDLPAAAVAGVLPARPWTRLTADASVCPHRHPVRSCAARFRDERLVNRQPACAEPPSGLATRLTCRGSVPEGNERSAANGPGGGRPVLASASTERMGCLPSGRRRRRPAYERPPHRRAWPYGRSRPETSGPTYPETRHLTSWSDLPRAIAIGRRPRRMFGAARSRTAARRPRERPSRPGAPGSSRRARPADRPARSG